MNTSTPEAYRGGAQFGSHEAQGPDQQLVEAQRGGFLELLHQEAEHGGQESAQVGARFGNQAVEQRKRFAFGGLRVSRRGRKERRAV